MSNSTSIRPTLIRDEAGTLLGQTMGLGAVTAGAFALGAYLGRNVAYQWGWLFLIGSPLCLIGLNGTTKRSGQAAISLLIGFGGADRPGGGADARLPRVGGSAAVWETGGATALFVAGFGAAGFATRRDLSTLARGLFWALIALIAFGIVTIFVRIPNGALVYAIAGLVVFAGLTPYDSQRMRRSRHQDGTAPRRFQSSSSSSTCSSCRCRSSVAAMRNGRQVV